MCSLLLSFKGYPLSVRPNLTWQPPQTAPHINIRHKQSVWVHWYVIHGNTVAVLHRYTHITLLRFWVLGHYLWSQNDVITSWLRLTATSNCSPHQYWTYTKCLSTLICCLWEYSSSLTQLYPHYLVQILGFRVTYGVEMMLLRHGWGWQPPQTVSPIHVRYIQSVWAHWYVVHGNTLAALHSYTHLT
jgi:hypothetical protein